MSVNEKMTILADAVRAKSGATGKLSIDGMTSAVKSITVGSGINTSDATAVSSDILSGKTAYMNGQKITGTMRNCGDFQKELTPADYYASGGSGYYSLVNIQIDTSVRRTFTPSKEKQEYKGTVEGKFLTDVTVEPIPDEYVSTEDATASASDISAGVTAYVKGELVTGTLEDVTAVVDGATVTIPAGRIRKEQTLTVQGGSVTVDRDTVTVTEGYVNEATLTVPAGSVSLDKDTITVAEGYVEEQTLTVPAGSVVINKNINKVIVTEGYVPSQELDLPGGFQLVKVTNYHPAREGFTAPVIVMFSGLGTVESEWGDSADFSDVNGVFVVTEDTKYKKGLARVYKQRGGKYYLCGYDPSGMDWAEYSAHWYVSETVGGYGWSAKMSCYSSAEVPNGAANWSSDMIGEFSVTTTITTETISSLAETALAQSVTAFDPDTAEWTEGDAVDISSYSITPQTNGIYFAQGGKLVGQHIDRELHIPQDGLVRRFKAVGKHFADTCWGTEMQPSGDISYDELGYCGNTAAPFTKNSAYLAAENTLGIPDEMTMCCFVKPYSGTGMLFGFGSRGENQATIALHTNGATCRGNIEYFDPGIVYGRWNVLVMTRVWDNSNKIVTAQVYANGKLIRSIEDNGLMNGPSAASWIGVMADSAVFSSSGSVTGQIDEACIWNRILTDEEIADMAKGVEIFNWDIPVEPYVQEQPVLSLSGTNGRHAESGQTVTGNEDASDVLFRDGAIYSYSGSVAYQDMNVGAVFLHSNEFSLYVEIHPDYARDSKVMNPIINAGSGYSGLYIKQIDGTGEYRLGYYLDREWTPATATIPLQTWTSVAVTFKDGVYSMYTQGVLKATEEEKTFCPPRRETRVCLFPEASYGYGFRGAIRNIRIYNRAITYDEIAELSGIPKEEETE